MSVNFTGGRPPLPERLSPSDTRTTTPGLVIEDGLLPRGALAFAQVRLPTTTLGRTRSSIYDIDAQRRSSKHIALWFYAATAIDQGREAAREALKDDAEVAGEADS
jgi:hypothetical protein